MTSQIILCENGHPAGAVRSRISWDEAKQLILSGQVAQVTQLHSLEVRLLLKDGRMVVTTEPAIDDVFELVRQCGAPCDDIVLVTE
jgi:hypothetical protein